MIDIGKIRRSVARRRRADGNYREFAGADRGRGILDRPEFAALNGDRRQLRDHLLDDRRFAAIDHVDLGVGNVDADDVMAKLGEAGARNGADISKPENRYSHLVNPAAIRGRLSPVELKFSRVTPEGCKTFSAIRANGEISVINRLAVVNNC